MKNFINYPNFIFSGHRLLLRTIVRPVFMTSGEFVKIYTLYSFPFRGWGQIRLA